MPGPTSTVPILVLDNNYCFFRDLNARPTYDYDLFVKLIVGNFSLQDDGVVTRLIWRLKGIQAVVDKGEIKELKDKINKLVCQRAEKYEEILRLKEVLESPRDINSEDVVLNLEIEKLSRELEKKLFNVLIILLNSNDKETVQFACRALIDKYPIDIDTLDFLLDAAMLSDNKECSDILIKTGYEILKNKAYSLEDKKQNFIREQEKSKNENIAFNPNVQSEGGIQVSSLARQNSPGTPPKHAEHLQINSEGNGSDSELEKKKEELSTIDTEITKLESDFKQYKSQVALLSNKPSAFHFSNTPSTRNTLGVAGMMIGGTVALLGGVILVATGGAAAGAYIPLIIGLLVLALSYALTKKPKDPEPEYQTTSPILN